MSKWFGEWESYDAYLASPEWQRTRRWALALASGRCQLCDAADRLEVHHRHYRRVGSEAPGDVIVLCADCHARFHDKLPKQATGHQESTGGDGGAGRIQKRIDEDLQGQREARKRAQEEAVDRVLRYREARFWRSPSYLLTQAIALDVWGKCWVLVTYYGIEILAPDGTRQADVMPVGRAVRDALRNEFPGERWLVCISRRSLRARKMVDAQWATRPPLGGVGNSHREREDFWGRIERFEAEQAKAEGKTP